MTELLKILYWNLYTPYENKQTEQELDDYHKQLIDVLGKPERKLVLRIIDGKDRLADEIGLDSFIFGFKLAIAVLNMPIIVFRCIRRNGESVLSRGASFSQPSKFIAIT